MMLTSDITFFNNIRFHIGYFDDIVVKNRLFEYSCKPGRDCCAGDLVAFIHIALITSGEFFAQSFEHSR